MKSFYRKEVGQGSHQQKKKKKMKVCEDSNEFRVMIASHWLNRGVSIGWSYYWQEENLPSC